VKGILILAYISKDSPVAAASLQERVDEVILHTASFPFIGHEIDEAGMRMLSLVRYPYLIFYRVQAGEILHIHQAARPRPDFG